MKLKILAVIPARYQSQRFPGKPLVNIGNSPMVQRVFEAAKSCSNLDRVIVATESEKIAQCVRGFGGEVELTADTHETGTDRIAEVAVRHPEYDVVVNVQGDQPFVSAHMLEQLVAPYLASALRGEALPEMTTLACPLNIESDLDNPNVAKVICDRHSNALYFSRSPIPYFRTKRSAPVYHHLGLYAFRADFLAKYTQLEATPLEQCESLEQLRVLEHGYRIRVCQTETAIIEINTPEDLAAAQLLIAEGTL
jgi:3-deoxy-manno-octulosonate cytidylyltransferase (CMP-KDO synthetase)